MSEKEFSKEGNIPHVPEEHAPEEHDEAASSASGGEQEAEVHEAELRPVETESRDSGHDSPLHHTVDGSRASGHDPALEGAVGGVLDDVLNDDRSNRRRIKSGKADIFRKFFDKEYDQPQGVPILYRQRHVAERQMTEKERQRHLSADSTDSRRSDPNPLGFLQYVGTSTRAILNQAGAILGKNDPKEEIDDFKRFGTEYGQSLPPIPTEEGSEHSISSVETGRIGDLYYAAPPARPPSDDSRGLSPGSSFPSFSSRPPTDTSDYVVTYPPPGYISPEGDRPLSPTPTGFEYSEGDKLLSPTTNADLECSAQGKRVRQRRFGVVSQPVQIRSKSAHASYSCYEGKSDKDLLRRKISNDMSVCSEPLPQRKISKDSSDVDYEQMSLEDEPINYPESSHSLERDTCLPMPDLDPADLESLRENLDGLTAAPDIIVTNAVEPNAVLQETEREHDPDTPLTVASDIVSDAVEPNAVRQETESEHDPDTPLTVAPGNVTDAIEPNAVLKETESEHYPTPLTVASDIATDAVQPNLVRQETESERDPDTILTVAPDNVTDAVEPNVVRQETAESERLPDIVNTEPSQKTRCHYKF